MGVTQLAERRALVTPDRLGAFFSARTIAVVGASDTSSWAVNLMRSIEVGGGVSTVEFVHPKHRELFGRPTVPTLRDLPEAVDLAFVMVGPNRVSQILDDAAAAGICNAVVLAAGYGEAGDEGKQKQGALLAQAQELGMTLMGPNTIGFINATQGIAPWAVASHRAPLAGPVSAVFESGSMSRATYEYAQAHAVGISHWVSLGNSAVMNTLDVLEFLIEDEATRSIALFLETIREPERFIPLAHRALEADKPIVVYKAGRSEAGMRAAMAHTGAMATNDAVVDQAFRQAGVIRVESLESLVSTAGLLGYTSRRPGGRRMGVVTSSGGGCNVIADLAQRHRLELPEWSATTVAALAEHLPPFAHTLNPLDTTGFGHARARPRHTKAEDDLMEIAAEDDGIDFMFTMMTPLPPEEPDDPTFIESRMKILGEIAAVSKVPVFFSSNTNLDITDYARKLLHDNDIHLLPGVDLAMSSLGSMMDWVDQQVRVLGREPVDPAPPAAAAADVTLTWDEADGRDLMAAHGVPMVPAVLASSSDEAVAAAEAFDGPVVLKVCSPDILHKSDVGGVALGLGAPDQVRAAHDRILAAARAAVPEARVRGVLVSPMRDAGLELLVGVTTDPTFGPVLTVGLGGVWVEVMRDSAMRVLPVARSEVVEMLLELKGSALLLGSRGSEPVDLERLAQVVLDISTAALSLGPGLVAVEVNPLRIGRQGIEGLDALVVTEATA